MVYSARESRLRRELRKVVRHIGIWEDFEIRLMEGAKTALAEGEFGRKIYADFALKFIADERNMYAGMMYLRNNGGGSPGPDGMTHDSFIDERERWAHCRAWRDDIKLQCYLPGEFIQRKIPKSSGSGHRTICIQNLQDRVVCRAAHQVLTPILDPLFKATSFGFRPRQHRGHAIVKACEVAFTEQKFFWVHADIKNAFDSVPLNPVLELLHKHLPAPALMNFLKRSLRLSERQKGLLQGSSLSPLLLNLYLHHKLDRPWPKLSRHVTLIRFADDILLLAKTRRAAKRAIKNLKHLLAGASMELRDAEPIIHDLRAGERACFLGFDCGLQDGRASVSVAEKSVDRLIDKLMELAGDPNAARAAYQRLGNWFREQAAAYSQPLADQILDRILEALQTIKVDRKLDEVEFCEPFNLGSKADWREVWQDFHAAWRSNLSRKQAQMFAATPPAQTAGTQSAPLEIEVRPLRPGRIQRAIRPRGPEIPEATQADWKGAVRDCNRCLRQIRVLEGTLSSAEPSERAELSWHREQIEQTIKTLRRNQRVNFQQVCFIDNCDTTLECWPPAEQHCSWSCG